MRSSMANEAIKDFVFSTASRAQSPTKASPTEQGDRNQSIQVGRAMGTPHTRAIISPFFNNLPLSSPSKYVQTKRLIAKFGQIKELARKACIPSRSLLLYCDLYTSIAG